MPKPPGAVAPSLRGVVGPLNWEHWEGWSCVGAGGAQGWSGCSADVMGARSVFGETLCAFLPYTPWLPGQEGPASGNPPISPSSPHCSPHLSCQMPDLGCRGETHVGVPAAEQSPPRKLLAWEQKNPDVFPFQASCHRDALLPPAPQSGSRAPGSPGPLTSPGDAPDMAGSWVWGCQGVPGCSVTPRASRMGTELSPGSQTLPYGMRETEAGATGRYWCNGTRSVGWAGGCGWEAAR